MSTTQLVILYIMGVAFTYGLYANLSRIKSYKSDIANSIFRHESALNWLNILRSMFCPLTTVIILLDIAYFIIFETKENFDSGVVKCMVKEHGKEQTRRDLKKFFDIMPYYIEKQLKR
jgi:hypothetical protein